MTATPVNETTQGREEARRAVAASQRSSRRADTLIAETTAMLGLARAHRESNHFADKFRAIIQGGTTP